MCSGELAEGGKQGGLGTEFSHWVQGQSPGDNPGTSPEAEAFSKIMYINSVFWRRKIRKR